MCAARSVLTQPGPARGERPGEARIATVVLLGTLDTKGREYSFVRSRILAAGCDALLVDAGVMSESSPADVTADAVAAAGGADRRALALAGDRGAAMAAMTRGAAVVVRRLYEEGRLDGILALGGSGGTSLAAAAMQTLPVGVPKLIVSTMASGDTRSFVGTTDIALMYSVVDIAGINGISERILANAAAAIAAMATAAADFVPTRAGRPLIGATMYGVTTPCVTVARELLEERGYEVLVFHATGLGGRSMEALMRSGLITGALDVTTTELADELVGGAMSAGPDRLEAAGALGLPQVVSLGALDEVAFGPPDSVPARLRDRDRYVHNAAVTLIRTSAEECAELGRIIARKLNAARGPVTVFVPLAGLSMIDVPGAPFHDPAADAALVRELRAGLRPDVEVVEMATHINDPAFARAMAERLDVHYRAWAAGRPGAITRAAASPAATTGSAPVGAIAAEHGIAR